MSLANSRDMLYNSSAMKTNKLVLGKDGYRKLKFNVGLALSGGGTKGIAHIGVFRAFEEEHIKFDCVAGTSAGGIFGSLYAAGMDWQTMLDEVKKINKRDIINSLFTFGSDA